ncbi:PREDICTED: uncharacterized protein LOC104730215 isoform X1 [Camelina sativa]|uniref:Uncharacterized protein LOC104730215 isoform X1 n=1 Tax=Camelina sativa TaxID=90675 RepID=A0ABM0UX65_CAMSA|nr:PREDICTED: uncharacterized protein LOC104730215 isoform X1 [Camelina sativa]
MMRKSHSGKVKMLTLQHSSSFISFSPSDNKLRSLTNGFTIMSKKRDFAEKSNQKGPLLRIKVPNTILARSAIAVLGLGFIDAGYSGDWSRIGVISKETEQLLKIAAFLVVPLCIFLALSFSDDTTD